MAPSLFAVLAAVLAAVLVVGAGALFVLRCRVRVPPGKALVVDGSGPSQVSFADRFVWPPLQRGRLVDLTVVTLSVVRRGGQGLICADGIRADVEADFYLSVGRSPEQVLAVANGVGCERAADRETLEQLFGAKLVEALKAVWRRHDFLELHAHQDRARDELLQRIGEDLGGYVLQDIAIPHLDPTPLEQLDAGNILDAQGIRKTLEATASARHALDQQVAQRVAEIQADPAAFEPYDLNGDGVLDEAELARLRRILIRELETGARRAAKAKHRPATGARLLRGRYELLETLGAGGQGKTWLAYDRVGGQQVAVKELLLGEAADWKAVELFEREGATLRELSHPAIPRYVDAFGEDDAEGGGRGFYIVQEAVDGRDLERLLASGKRFGEPEVLRVLREALVVLDYLHTLAPPVIHRDLKPSNLMRRRSDGSIALVDFGAIGELAGSATRAGSTFIGTSGYMAPEQFMGIATPASDLYALGATAIHLLGRTHPADLPLVRMRLAYHDAVHASPELIRYLDRLLEPHAEDRFASAREAMTALAELSG